jgi:ribosomal protein S18 acetylase RimI-like enzyme
MGMPKESITIRNGTEKDLDAFFDLYWVSSSEHVKYNEDFEALKTKEKCKDCIVDRQKEYLKDKDQSFFVAIDEEKIIGIAVGHIGTRDESDIYEIEKMGFVDELCVAPEYRKSGVGKKLLDKLIQELFERDIKFIGLGVAYKNPAVDFYLSQGFSPASLWMVRGKKKEKITEKVDIKNGNGLSHNPYGRGKATIPFVVVVKPESVMGEYIALHGLVPQNELPESLRHQIPANEIWIREEIYNDPKRREEILEHEKFELTLMETKGLTYKQAHRIAELHEQVYKIEDEMAIMQEEFRLKTFEPVKLVEKTSEGKTKDVKEEKTELKQEESKPKTPVPVEEKKQ